MSKYYADFNNPELCDGMPLENYPKVGQVINVPNRDYSTSVQVEVTSVEHTGGAGFGPTDGDGWTHTYKVDVVKL